MRPGRNYLHCRRRLGYLLLALCFLLSGCGSDGRETGSKEREILIGLSLDSLVVERWQKDRDFFITEAERLGARVLVENAIEDPFIQIAQIQSLIMRKVDVLVIIPNHMTLLAPVIQEARDRNIPVISYDRLILNAPVDLYLSFDNVEVGRLMASAMINAVPRGDLVLINGARNDNNSALFNQGFMKALGPEIEAGRIRLVDELWPESWRNQEARDFVEGLLNRELSFGGVIAANDFLADQAIQALAERRMTGEVFVVGHDADLLAAQRIVEGIQLATVYKPIHLLAELAAVHAVSLARRTRPETLLQFDNGWGSIPSILIQPILVTKDNLDQTLIADGFHKREDVYRSQP